MNYYTYLDTPLGKLLLLGTKEALTGLYFDGQPHPKISDSIKDDSVFGIAKKQLTEYFDGKRKTFDIPLEFSGTEFQKSVWKELFMIPYGANTSYKAVAEAIGRPKAVRAVGTAIGDNPICIIGPCHRVISSSGGLGGYAGGLENKKRLLKLEGIAI